MGHGLSRTPTYRSWISMVYRCCRPEHRSYPDYGGRGISLCERWCGPHGFETFLADMGERPAGTQIDRIANDGNYEPGNCRWSTVSRQARNRRSTRFVKWEGRWVALPDLCERLGLPEAPIRKRLNRGRSVVEAFTIPIGRQRNPSFVRTEVGRG